MRGGVGALATRRRFFWSDARYHRTIVSGLPQGVRSIGPGSPTGVGFGRALPRPAATLRIANLSFGGTAAIVTSVALIFGLDAATATKSTIVSGLLIVALADNLTDALSMHVYEESKRRLQPREAFIATLTNFFARLAVALTFVLLVVLLPLASAVIASGAWGLALLVALTWALARERKLGFAVELAKHIAAALTVILVARAIGIFITAQLP